jgi:PAS domain S-box-containing protein
MADTAPVMIWVSGTDKGCTFFNKAWLTFTGRSMEQELGDGWSEGVQPDDQERCFATYVSSFDSRQNFQMEYRLRSAEGTYRWVLDTGVPRFAPGGGFSGYIGSCIDITDLRDAQEKAIEAQKLESLKVMTNGVAHDFNNLLGSILSEAELAESELAEGPGREGLQRIKTVAVRGAEIVRELMIYSGQDRTNFEPVDVSRLVEEISELLKVSISKHAVLKTDLPHNLPAALGNATEIRRLAMNLIINASEAIGDESGVISVSTSCIVAANAARGRYVRLEVSDTGCGMAEHSKAKIFDPFFTTKFAGRGLGLAVVQGIVRAHRGEIKVTSAPGLGTTFEILLPCAGEPEFPDRRAAVPASNEQSFGPPGKVLVVEDEEALRLSVSKMLRKAGFSIIEAGDGSVAIDLFHRHQDSIDAILLDMTIPGTSSREVIAEVRRLRPNVKVILTSAYSREMVMPNVDEPQFTSFIRKPFPIGSLVQMLTDSMASSVTRSPS